MLNVNNFLAYCTEEDIDLVLVLQAITKGDIRPNTMIKDEITGESLLPIEVAIKTNSSDVFALLYTMHFYRKLSSKQKTKVLKTAILHSFAKNNPKGFHVLLRSTPTHQLIFVLANKSFYKTSHAVLGGMMTEMLQETALTILKAFHNKLSLQRRFLVGKLDNSSFKQLRKISKEKLKNVFNWLPTIDNSEAEDLMSEWEDMPTITIAAESDSLERSVSFGSDISDGMKEITSGVNAVAAPSRAQDLTPATEGRHESKRDLPKEEGRPDSPIRALSFSGISSE